MQDKHIDPNQNLAKTYREITINSAPFQKILKDAQNAANQGSSYFSFEINKFEYLQYHMLQECGDIEYETPLTKSLVEMGFSITSDTRKSFWGGERYIFTISW